MKHILDDTHLFDFIRFIFRSGEDSFRKLKSWEFSENIDEYIKDTWNIFETNRKIKLIKGEATNVHKTE